MKNTYEVDLKCGCGATIQMAVFTHKEASQTIDQFNKAHQKCREPSVWQQVFGSDTPVSEDLKSEEQK